jgi:endonuclease/exonuclease/phosphatase family metal-dependent hydrolase
VEHEGRPGRRGPRRARRHRIIADHDPDVILLQEAMDYVSRMRLRFRGWRVYSGRLTTVRANCPIMVRRRRARGRIRGRGWGLVVNRRPWVYRGKGREVTHPGRVWTWARVEGIRFLSVHRATEALGHNERAGAEEADHLEYWFDSHDGPAFAAGDWNNLWSDKRRDSPAAIARTVKGELVVLAEARIDYALATGLTVTCERAGKYGSDHHAHVYRLTR